MLQKYRAWDKKRKQMRYQDKEFFYIGLRQNLKGNEFYKTCYESIDNFFTPAQGELMQFVNKIDKYKKEIYEGDILRGYDTSGKKVYDIKVTMRNSYTEIWFDGTCDIEVIGNKYEGIFK